MDTEESASDSEQEGLETVLSDLNAQMATIDSVSTQLTRHVTELFQRAKRETVDWMQEPLKPRAGIDGWCRAQGLSATPTLEEFIDACFSAAVSLDLEARVVTMKKEDAEILWRGRRRMSVFEILASIPTLFY